MNIEEVRQKVAEIEKCKNDSERAHDQEDLLHVAFIRFVAETGNKTLSAMAKEVLKTGEISFPRWTA